MLSGAEIERLLEATESSKYREIFMLAYGAELRISEVRHLCVEDIDSGRGLIHVRKGKTGERYAPLGNRVVAALRAYWRERRPSAGFADAMRDGRHVLPDGDSRAWRRRLSQLHQRSWVMYAKRPFGGADQVFRYLARYTHRIAISSTKLVAYNGRGVTFRTRGDHTVTLSGSEFTRRFLDHVLPSGFVKIRHFGLLASGNVRSRLQRAQALLGAQPPQVESDAEPDTDFRDVMLRTTGLDLRVCSRCHQPAVKARPHGSSPARPSGSSDRECQAERIEDARGQGGGSAKRIQFPLGRVHVVAS
ncbi:MAG: transposase [Polyangiaceae bacterium]